MLTVTLLRYILTCGSDDLYHTITTVTLCLQVELSELEVKHAKQQVAILRSTLATLKEM